MTFWIIFGIFLLIGLIVNLASLNDDSEYLAYNLAMCLGIPFILIILFAGIGWIHFEYSFPEFLEEHGFWECVWAGIKTSLWFIIVCVCCFAIERFLRYFR